MVKELGCQIVTQKTGSEVGWSTKQIGEEWRTFHRPFLIPQTAIFCIAMDAKKHSSFAAKIKRSKEHEKYF